MDSLVILRLGKQQYGLPVTSVSEIIQMVAVTEMPDLPPGVLGMINYRGDVIPLLDLRQIYNTPIQRIRLNTLIVIAKTHSGKLGLLVDGVHGVQNYRLSEQNQTTKHHAVESIVKTEDKVILMINLVTLAGLVEPLTPLLT